MDILDLVSRSHGAELHVFLGLAVAHLQGADTVNQGWLVTHTNQSRNTVSVALRRLESWGLVECLTVQSWRLSAAGRDLRLPAQNAQQLCILADDKAVDGSELSTGLSTGYQLDSVGLRLETHKSCASSEKCTKDQHFSLCGSGGLNRESLLIKQPQPQNETHKSCAIPNWAAEQAEVLADILRERVHCKRGPLVATLVKRIQAGANPDQLELDLLLLSAYVTIGDGRGLRNKGGWIVSELADGTASRALRDVMAAAKPERDGAYAGFLDGGEDWQHPDLARVDELIVRLDGVEA